MSNLDFLLSRGVEQVLPDKKGLADLMAKRKIRVYLGIDPTGNLLTLGHAVVLRKLQQFADLGHEVMLLIGNGTVRFGDPTSKDSTRPELTDAVIEANFKSWQEQASKVLDFSKIKIVRNGDWLDKLSYVDLVKLLAKTTIQQLLERDMFQDRLKNNLPIHGHEIIYPLLQGYDSVHLEVDLEIGGSDQLFNMMMGRTLLKIYKNKDKFVLTTPIINGTDGRKMSKSYGNFIALTEDPINMYGKLMRVADEEIITYFEILTDLSDEEINRMKQAIAAGENPMQFKKHLALEITSWLHDENQAQQAAEHFQKTIQDQEIPADIQEVKFAESTATLLSLASACLPQESKTNLRRLIEQGAVSLNDEKITDSQQTIENLAGKIIKVGKRKYFRLVK